MNPMIKVDLHCHTSFSRDSTIQIKDLINECDRKDITRIAITDHNSIHGAMEAAARWPERIIPGVEIMTSQGELLAYFIREAIPKGLPPSETVSRLQAQGAVISVSHPFDRFRAGGWKTADLLDILQALDAIEIFNAHCITERPNELAAAFAFSNNLPGTSGSDAHAIGEIGSAGLVMYDFNDPQSMRLALSSARVFGKRTPLIVRLINRITHSLR